MGRKKTLELTKCVTKYGEQWKKYRHGQTYYFSGDYNTCLVAWHKKLAELEAEETTRQLTAFHWQQIGKGNPDFPPTLRAAIEEATKDKKPTDLISFHGDTAKQLQLYVDCFVKHVSITSKQMVNQLDMLDFVGLGPEKKRHVLTVGAAIQQFLLRQSAKVTAGKLSAGRYDTINRCVNHFGSFVGNNSSVSNITGATLTNYHTLLLEEQKKNSWSNPYSEFYIAICKQFLIWLDENDYLDRLPKNIKSKDFHFTTEPNTIKIFSTNEIKTLLSNCSERTKLFLLLMLNTSMQQQDIATLTPAMVTNGRIIRRRSKTKTKKTTPEVNWILWKETRTLLEKYGNTKGDLVFLNESGKPLKVEELRDGKLCKIDNIHTAWTRLQKKLLKNKLIKEQKQLKLLRKTSPSLLANNPEYFSFAQHFLGHSARTTFDKSYRAYNQDTFDKAVIWLGTQYGVN